MPTGIAVDPNGRVYVADTGNGRVQVILPATVQVEAVLAEGLIRPVHVAIDNEGTIFVADAGTGRVHPFSARFAPLPSVALASIDPWSGAPWTSPPAPGPLAVAALDDGTLALFDPARPALWHMTANGTPLPALPWPAADAPPPGWSALPGRFAPEGEIVLGPIDSGTYNFAWHRVKIDAEIPSGTSLRIQTFAANKIDAGVKAWAPRAPVAVPDRAADRDGEDYDRLVLRDTAAWERWKIGPMDRARPEVHRFEGGGPAAADRFTLPAAAAVRLQVGDRIFFATDGGGASEARIVAADPRAVSIAASGPAAAFAAPDSVWLLERDGRPIAYGPLDLAFLVPDPAILALGGLNRAAIPSPPCCRTR